MLRQTAEAVRSSAWLGDFGIKLPPHLDENHISCRNVCDSFDVSLEQDACDTKGRCSQKGRYLEVDRPHTLDKLNRTLQRDTPGQRDSEEQQLRENPQRCQ